MRRYVVVIVLGLFALTDFSATGQAFPLLRAIEFGASGEIALGDSTGVTVFYADFEQIAFAPMTMAVDLEYDDAGRRLLMAGRASGTIAIWDVMADQFLLTRSAPSVTTVAWSPEEDGFLSLSDGLEDTIVIRDTESGAVIVGIWYDDAFAQSPYFIPVAPIAGDWHPSENVVATEYRELIQVWDAELDWQGSFVVRGRRPVAWSPTGEHLLVGTYDGGVQVIQYETREPVLTFEGVTDIRASAHSASWSPDGSRVAVTFDNGWTSVLGLACGCEMIRLNAGVRWDFIGADAIDWSPDGTRLGVVDGASRATIWETESFRVVARYVVNEGWTVLDAED